MTDATSDARPPQDSGSDSPDGSWSLSDLELRELESAWGRVEENEGCAGVDGVTVEDFGLQVRTALPELLREAVGESYRALPLRKIIVEKWGPGPVSAAEYSGENRGRAGLSTTERFRIARHQLEASGVRVRSGNVGSGRTRLLLVPAVRDRVLQTALGRMLARDWEEEFLNASYAYRRGRGVDRAVEQIVGLRDRGWTWVVEADISAYFDTIPHRGLEKMLAERGLAPDVLRLLGQWIEAVSWDGRKAHPLKRGIPQGSPISPLFANLYLTPFDEALEKQENRLIRYADDFIILCRSAEAAQGALAEAGRLLKSAGLTLNPEKTRVTTFDEGFAYLGITFRGKEAMIPWKPKQRMGHLVFLAHRMPSTATEGISASSG